MTDKEMALEIGEKFISLRYENAALRGVLSSLRVSPGVPLDWEQMKDEVLARQFPQSIQEQTESLQQSIGNLHSRDSYLCRLYENIANFQP
jgi:hypothetical protein